MKFFLGTRNNHIFHKVIPASSFLRRGGGETESNFTEIPGDLKDMIRRGTLAPGIYNNGTKKENSKENN
jgi:hypothetical protein